MTGDNSTRVTVRLKTGTGRLQGTTTVTVVRGIARFKGLTDKKAESIVLVFGSGTLSKATSKKITISSGLIKGKIVGADAKVKETGQAMSRLAIRGASFSATTRPHAGVAVTPRSRQSSAPPAGGASWLQAVGTANRASVVVRADSAPLRVRAELKASLAAYLVAERHTRSDRNNAFSTYWPGMLNWEN
jgi:hypothetical protein